MRVIRGIAQCAAESFDSRIDAVVEIHHGVVGPELSLDFVASYDLAPALNQHSQDLEGLFPKENLIVIAVGCANRAQFTRLEIKLKASETGATWSRMFHGPFEIG